MAVSSQQVTIHPTALVHDKAQLGVGVEIGPFTIVGVRTWSSAMERGSGRTPCWTAGRPSGARCKDFLLGLCRTAPPGTCASGRSGLGAHRGRQHHPGTVTVHLGLRIGRRDPHRIPQPHHGLCPRRA